MIGKIMKNHSFRKTCAYVLGKKGAEIIGGNMAGRNFQEIYYEFGMSGLLNPLVKRPVYHFALSFAPDEPIEDEMFVELGEKYVERMGLDLAANQFVMVRHTDQAHHHIHIVASRLHLITGKAVSDSFERYRNQVVCRQLEIEYGLRQVESTYMTEGMKQKLEQDFGLKMPDGPVTGRKTRTSQQTKKLERYGEAVQVKLQDAIDRAAQSMDLRNSVNQTVASPLLPVTEVVTQPVTMPQFVERLQAMGVQVQIRWVTDRKKTKATGDRHEKVQGISYQLEGVAMAGNDLGAWYTFPGLQKHRGIDYQSDRDDELLKILVPKVETEQSEAVRVVPLDRPMTMKDLLRRSESGQDETGETDIPVEESGEDTTEGTDDTGPEWKLLPSFANVRHAQEAIAPTDEPIDESGATDGDDEDSGMGGRTRQSDDEDSSRDLLDAIEGERLLEPTYSAPTESVEQEVVQFPGTPDSDRAETVAEFYDKTEPEEIQEPPAIALNEDETSNDTYIYDTSSEPSESSEVDTYIYDTFSQASQSPEAGDPLEAARQKLQQNPVQELSDDERQLLRRHYRTVYENLKAQVNNQLTGQDRDRAVVKLAVYRGRFTDSELGSIAVMGDYAQSIEQKSGQEKAREEAALLVKEVKQASLYRSKKRQQADPER